MDGDEAGAAGNNTKAADQHSEQHAMMSGDDNVSPTLPAACPSGFSLLGGIPSGAIQQVLDFQKSHKERASLRLTSKRLCSEVEIFCKEALLARLKKKHRVDDTFNQRIRDQNQSGDDSNQACDSPILLPALESNEDVSVQAGISISAGQ